MKFALSVFSALVAIAQISSAAPLSPAWLLSAKSRLLEPRTHHSKHGASATNLTDPSGVTNTSMTGYTVPLWAGNPVSDPSAGIDPIVGPATGTSGMANSTANPSGGPGSTPVLDHTNSSAMPDPIVNPSAVPVTPVMNPNNTTGVPDPNNPSTAPLGINPVVVPGTSEANGTSGIPANGSTDNSGTMHIDPIVGSSAGGGNANPSVVPNTTVVPPADTSGSGVPSPNASPSAGPGNSTSITNTSGSGTPIPTVPDVGPSRGPGTNPVVKLPGTTDTYGTNGTTIVPTAGTTNGTTIVPTTGITSTNNSGATHIDPIVGGNGGM